MNANKDALRIVVVNQRDVFGFFNSYGAAEKWALANCGTKDKYVVQPLTVLADPSAVAAAPPDLIAKLQRDIKFFRARVFGCNRVKGSDHSTACTIWGDDGRGGTEEGFEEPLPCNCGALENFARSQYVREREEAAHPVGAAVEVTDEMVQAACEALTRFGDSEVRHHWAVVGDDPNGAMKAALKAALSAKAPPATDLHRRIGERFNALSAEVASDDGVTSAVASRVRRELHALLREAPTPAEKGDSA